MMNRPVATVAFFGFALPDELFRLAAYSDRSMPIQTHKFGWAVVDAMESSGVSVVPISAAPVRDFPHNRQVLFRGSAFQRGGTRGRTVSFLNLTGLKHLTRFFSAAHIGRQVAAERTVDAIFVHGVNSSLLWVAHRMGRRLRIPTVVIITDPPSLTTAYDNRATSWMKKLDRRLILSALGRASGVVVLAPKLAAELCSDKPWILMEGIANRPPTVRAQMAESWPPSAVYAGGLHESYGVRDLIDAVALSSGTWNLEIYGKGPMEDEVKEASRADERILFGGVLGGQDLTSAYQRAALLVNPRKPDADFVEYSFPSKLLEYMASGVPVLTTRLPNIPDDYLEHLVTCEAGAGGLAASIDEVMKLAPRERAEMGIHAQEFILATRGKHAQGAKLLQFVHSLRNAVAR